MIEALNLQLISSVGNQTLRLLWFEVTTPTGEFVIGPGHQPLVSLVSPQSKLLYKKTDGTMGMFVVCGGVLHVEHNEVTLLLDSPIEAEDKQG